MRDLTGELQPQTHISSSLIQHCVCVLQANTCIIIWCVTMNANETHVPYEWISCSPIQHCVHTVTANNASIYTNEVG